MKKILFLALLFSVSNSYSCEKWKSEVGNSIWQIGNYVKLYEKYLHNKIDAADFQNKSASILKKVEDIRDYVHNTQSCSDPDDKFEKRKRLLEESLDYSILAIKNHEAIEEAVRVALSKLKK